MTDFGLHPASAGAIIGYLRVDKSDWDAKLAEAKAQADELSRGDTRIHISTNMTEVLAELALIGEAKDALNGNAHISVSADKIPSLGGERSETVNISSTGSAAAVAAQRELAAAMEETGASSDGLARRTQGLTAAEQEQGRVAGVAAAVARYAAAQEAQAQQDVSAADQEALRVKGQLNNALIDEQIARKHATAEAKYEADQIAWNNGALKQLIETRNAARAAAQEAAQASDGLGAATGGEAAAAEKAAAAGTAQAGAMGRILAVSPVLVGMLSSLGAATIGWASTLGMMGVSGVLAIEGIKTQMAEGTAVGAEYSSGLSQLHQIYRDLGTSAADQMLSSFNRSTTDLKNQMPFLNQDVGIFSNQLGLLGSTVLSSVLIGLHTMQPLMVASAVAMNQVATGAERFAGSTAFQQFVNFGVAQIPVVLHLFDAFGTLIGHVMTGFEQLGPIAFSVITGVVDILNMLPVPLLTGLLTTTVLLGPAMRAAFGVAPLITTVAEAIGLTGVMANLAVPGVGLLMAALAGLAVVSVSSAMATAQNTQATVDYTQALADDNDKIGAHVRQLAAQTLVEDGAAAAAQRHGIALTTLLDASLGVPSAMDQVKGAMQQLGDSTVEVAGHTTAAARQNQADYKLLGDTIGQQGKQIDLTKQKTQQLNGMLADTSSVTAATSATQRMAAAMGVTSTEYTAGVNAAAQAKAAADAQTEAMRQENDAAGLLNGALQLLNNGNLSLASAQTASAAGTNAVTKSLQTNGTVVDGNTAAAVANQQAIESKVQADQQEAQAVAKATGKTVDGVKAYQDSKKALEDALRAQGDLTPAVQAYIDKLYDVNNLKVKPTVLEVETAQALADARALQAYINSMQGTTLVNHIYSIYSESHVSTGQGGSGGQTMAAGGLVRHMADGGFNGPVLGAGSSTSDSVPIMGSTGEFMVKAAAVNKYGVPMMHAINNGVFQPVQAGPGNVTVYVTNPFTGDQVQAVVKSVATQVADGRINELERHKAAMRGGRA